jgi:Glu-tRNA(Gln) amidotransferase subunit E-like FAD-binding protein
MVMASKASPGRIWPEVDGGPLRYVLLPNSRSQIVKDSDGGVWLFNIPGRKGWFLKGNDEEEESHRRGRLLCRDVRDEYDCGGFLTTDELPRYGLGWRDREKLFKEYEGADPHRDVLVVLAYREQAMAEKIREYIFQALKDDSWLLRAAE